MLAGLVLPSKRTSVAVHEAKLTFGKLTVLVSDDFGSFKTNRVLGSQFVVKMMLQLKKLGKTWTNQTQQTMQYLLRLDMDLFSTTICLTIGQRHTKNETNWRCKLIQSGVLKAATLKSQPAIEILS